MNVGKYVYTKLNEKQNGFYVDVGANDGAADISHTLFLAQQGWNGICIEGCPRLFKKLCQSRQALFYNGFVSKSDNETLEIVYEHGGRGQATGLKRNIPPETVEWLCKARGAVIQTFTTKHLETILNELEAPINIDLLKVDVERSELEIISSLSYGRYRFQFISVECDTILHPQIVNELSQHNYKYLETIHGDQDIFQLKDAL